MGAASVRCTCLCRMPSFASSALSNGFTNTDDEVQAGDRNEPLLCAESSLGVGSVGASDLTGGRSTVPEQPASESSELT